MTLQTLPERLWMYKSTWQLFLHKISKNALIPLARRVELTAFNLKQKNTTFLITVSKIILIHEKALRRNNIFYEIKRPVIFLENNS